MAATATVYIDFTTDLSSGLAYYEQVGASGPYAYHRLKETSGTFADASGNGKTGTGAGTITYNQTGAPAITGDSNARHVVFTTDTTGVSFTGTTPTLNQLSLEARIYETSLSVKRVIFENDGGTLTKTLVEVWIGTDGSLNARATDGSAAVATAAGAIVINTAYTIGVVFDAATRLISFYKNGALVSSHTWQTSRNAAPSLAKMQTTWRWGTDTTVGSTQGSVRRLAEPAVFLRVLSASEFADHHAALATTPFAGYAWTDVTTYLYEESGITRKWGRENDLGDPSPMETTFTLRNRDRRFEIGYSSSPYFPFVLPGRPMRVTMTENAITYDWAFGYIEDFPQVYPEGELVGYVPIVARCQLSRMNRDPFGARDVVEQAAGARVSLMLNVTGHPTSMRDIDTGVNNMMAQTIENSSSGTHVKQVARSDRGLFYFDQRGYATFDDGAARTTNTRSTVDQGILGPSNIAYRSPNFHAPVSQVRNIITLRRPGGVDQVASDSSSQKESGPAPYGDELLLTTDSAVATRAAAILADFKDPTLRVQSVVFNPAASTGGWAAALGVRLGDRYEWSFAPRVGSAISRDVFVEGVSDWYGGDEYLSTWTLSLA